MTRNEVFLYAKECYGTVPDYPWKNSPKSAILRHRVNRKWFGAVLEITEDKLGLEGGRTVDVLLLKCAPLLVGSLRREPGIYPAYHMNKEHWITILLDGSCPKNRVAELLDLSFHLTK